VLQWRGDELTRSASASTRLVCHARRRIWPARRNMVIHSIVGSCLIEREREREGGGEGEKGDRYDSWTEKIALYIIFVIFFNSLETVSSCFIKKRFFITFVQWLASGKFIDILYYWKITSIFNLTHRSRIKFESERCNYATARRGLRIIRLDLMMN